MAKIKYFFHFFVRPLPIWYSKATVALLLAINAFLVAQIHFMGMVIESQRQAIDFLLSLLRARLTLH
jgi:hypothetical protein